MRIAVLDVKGWRHPMSRARGRDAVLRETAKKVNLLYHRRRRNLSAIRVEAWSMLSSIRAIQGESKYDAMCDTSPDFQIFAKQDYESWA